MDSHAKYTEGMYCEIVGQGRPIVALHGWSLDHRVMKECLEPTFRRRTGWQRIYVEDILHAASFARKSNKWRVCCSSVR